MNDLASERESTTGDPADSGVTEATVSRPLTVLVIEPLRGCEGRGGGPPRLQLCRRRRSPDRRPALRVEGRGRASARKP
jgi:hypothetical protein